MASTTLEMTATQPRAGTNRELRRGAASSLALLVGFAPFALVIGATVAEHPSPSAGWAASWLIYGGSAHLAVLDLTSTGGVLVAVVTGIVINARLVIYSAALAPHWRTEPWTVRALMAPTIVDPTFALVEPRYREGGSRREKRAYYLGAALTLWFGWMALITVGMVAGGRVPAGVGLEVAVPICLTALVVPSLSSHPGRLAVFVAVVVAIAGSGWPAGSGLLAAIVGGALAGGIAERNTERNSERHRS
jgi:predicted branched-subunit amino acid permease